MKSPAATLFALVVASAACDPNEDPSSPLVRVTMEMPDGQQSTEEGLYEEMVLPTVDGFRGYVVDGSPTKDPAAMLLGTEVSLAGPTDEPFVLVADGDRTLLVQGTEPPVTMSWSESFHDLEVGTEGSSIGVEIEGIEDPAARAQFAAATGALLLGADAVLTDQKTDFGITVGVIALAGIASIVACNLEGTRTCGEQSAVACGAGNVSRIRTICGMGFDFQGNLQLGMQCCFECQ